METVLESKQKEDLASFNNAKPIYYYSVYQLKANRIAKESPPKMEKAENTVTQFLDNEATINKDFSLTLLVYNIPDRNESYLRENVAKKIEKGTLYASNIGNISNFYLEFKKDDVDIESICYYYLYRQKQSPNNEYIVCFIIQNSIYNLDLFRNELDFYFQQNFEAHLETKDFIESEILKNLLSNWYETSINYVTRLLDLLDEKISIIIEEAFSCGDLSLDENLEETTKSDIRVMFNCLNSSYLISNFLDHSFMSPKRKTDKSIRQQQNAQRASVVKIVKDELKVNFDSDNKEIKFSKADKCKFTAELTSKLIEKKKETKDPFELKQILENYKLKLAQELNTFNRHLRKGEANYYDIYRSFLYLRNSPMNSLLIHMYTNNCEHANLYEPLKVVLDYFNNNNGKFQLFQSIADVIQN